MTVVNHPARPAVELNRRIAAEFAGRPCWQATLVLGSMVVLDFGLKRSLIGKLGRIVTIGELRVSIRDVQWFAEMGGKVVLTSDQINEGLGDVLTSVFVERELQRVDWGAYCSLVFSGGLTIRCDRTDAYENEGDEIAEFRFLNDDYVDCFADGTIETESSAQ